MIHKSRLAVMGTAAALVSAALLTAPTDSYAKKSKDDASSKSEKDKNGTRFYKAAICADGKVYGGGPKLNTLGCKAGFTTVSGQVTYDGKKAKIHGQPTCLANNAGPSNKVTWCGVSDNRAGAPNHFMSLGANGQMQLSGNVSGGVDGGAGGAGGQVGADLGLTGTRAYWMRIERPSKWHLQLKGRSE